MFDERFQLLGEPPRLCTPPIFIGFDVLQADRRDVRRLPLERRRPILEDVIDGGQSVLPVRRLGSGRAPA